MLENDSNDLVDLVDRLIQQGKNDSYRQQINPYVQEISNNALPGLNTINERINSIKCEITYLGEVIIESINRAISQKNIEISNEISDKLKAKARKYINQDLAQELSESNLKQTLKARGQSLPQIIDIGNCQQQLESLIYETLFKIDNEIDLILRSTQHKSDNTMKDTINIQSLTINGNGRVNLSSTDNSSNTAEYHSKLINDLKKEIHDLRREIKSINVDHLKEHEALNAVSVIEGELQNGSQNKAVINSNIKILKDLLPQVASVAKIASIFMSLLG
jgi:hypothetical protein